LHTDIFDLVGDTVIGEVYKHFRTFTWDNACLLAENHATFNTRRQKASELMRGCGSQVCEWSPNFMAFEKSLLSFVKAVDFVSMSLVANQYELNGLPPLVKLSWMTQGLADIDCVQLILNVPGEALPQEIINQLSNNSVVTAAEEGMEYDAKFIRHLLRTCLDQVNAKSQLDDWNGDTVAKVHRAINELDGKTCIPALSSQLKELMNHVKDLSLPALTPVQAMTLPLPNYYKLYDQEVVDTFRNPLSWILMPFQEVHGDIDTGGLLGAACNFG
jgi:hypothetical protein